MTLARSVTPGMGPDVARGSTAQEQVALPEYRPAWWLPHGVLQTVWMDLGRRIPQPPYRREWLATADGDTLALDHLDFPAARGRVVILHGLEGHSYTPRVAGLAWAARHRGFAVTAINCRSCAPDPADHDRYLPVTSPRLYHSGDTADLDGVLRRLRERTPGQALHAVAVSWGANTLLKWLGENPRTQVVDAAVAISPPYDLAASASFMKTGFGPYSVNYFLRTIVRKVDELLERYPAMRERIDPARIRRVKSFEELDDLLWAPLHGFRDAADFHARCSSLGLLGRITVPTLSLSALDDPLNPASILDRVAREISPAVRLGITPHGGHAAHFAGPGPWSFHSWAEDVTATWFDHWTRGQPSAGEDDAKTPTPTDRA